MSVIITDDDGNELVDLTIYVPQFIADMSDFDGLYYAAGLEEMRLRNAVDDLVLQNLETTATWSLSQWGEIYDASGATDDALRVAILSKMQARQTCTIEVIKAAALELTGEEVVITEYYSDYYFTITFPNILGAPDGIDAFLERLAIIVPAHLGYGLVYNYNTWGDANAALTWGGANNGYDWDTIRYEDLVEG